MAGQILIPLESDKKRYENALVQELTKRAVSQGVVDSAMELVVRDILPLTDLGGAGTTTGQSSATYGYRKEYWSADFRTSDANGTAVSTPGYVTAIQVDLNKQKVVGILGVRIRGEPNVAAMKYSLGSGAKIKDIWQLEGVGVDETYWAENPAIYNSTNVMKVEYYLAAGAAVQHVLVGKSAEAKGDTILGAD